MNHSASITHFKLTDGASQALLTVNSANKKLASTAAATLNKQLITSAGIDLSKAVNAKTPSEFKAEDDAADDSKQNKRVWWRQLMISESTRSGAKTASVARHR